MRNLLKTSSVLLGLSGVLCSFASDAAPPTVNIDFPAAGQTISGITSVNGWAAGAPSVDMVVLYVDGAYYGTMGYGGSREDVKNALPTVPNAGLSGFAAAVNTRLMKNGNHTLLVKAFNANNEVSTQSVIVAVSNAPGAENPTSVNLDMTGATARVLGSNKLVVEGATVNGKSVSTVLDFDPGTNHYVISSFVNDANGTGVSSKTGCLNDRDCDGVPDIKDSFPDNPAETWTAISNNGMGYNAEHDRDRNVTTGTSGTAGTSGTTVASGAAGTSTVGKSTYAANCASCHGTPTASRGWNAQLIRNAIQGNRGGMSGLSFLSDAQLQDIASYLANPAGISVTTGATGATGTAGTTGICSSKKKGKEGNEGNEGNKCEGNESHSGGERD